MSYMLSYLTCKNWHDYSLHARPEHQGQGGGMAVKTQRVYQALGQRYYTQLTSDIEEIDSPVVLVEPLFFQLYNHPETEKNLHWERLAELGKLSSDEGVKLILYCSEFEFMRWEMEFRQGVLNTFDAITCNCEYQAKMFSYYGVRPDAIMCDPIPTDIFTPSTEKPEEITVLATGNVSWEKNAEGVIKAFRALRKEGYQTAYVGSAHLWSKTKNPIAIRLQDELEAVTTYFHKSLSQSEVAVVMQGVTHGFWCATHECFGQGVVEMLGCGKPVISRNHGLAAERPHIVRKDVPRAIRSIESEYDKYSQTAREWTVANVSYESFLNQLGEVMRKL